MLLVGQPAAGGNPPYFATPAFWITDLGIAADAAGEAYQIDAYGLWQCGQHGRDC